MIGRPLRRTPGRTYEAGPVSAKLASLVRSFLDAVVDQVDQGFVAADSVESSIPPQLPVRVAHDGTGDLVNGVKATVGTSPGGPALHGQPGAIRVPHDTGPNPPATQITQAR
jgi:hypothetical protein